MVVEIVSEMSARSWRRREGGRMDAGGGWGVESVGLVSLMSSSSSSLSVLTRKPMKAETRS